ncbi:hypothetical protein AB6D11_03155 [Vibrio splendidus]
MNNYIALNVKTKVMCPIHGSIDLLSNELEVVDHPAFQRLRDISQNDILNYIFVGAKHDRFAHSIGTMHVASRMFQALFDSCARNHNFHYDALQELQDDAIYLLRIVRLSALMHDTGHGVFSHLSESSERYQDLMKASGLFTKLWSHGGHEGVGSRLYPKLPTHIKHEHYSVRMAHMIMSDVKMDDGMVMDVLSIMDTTSPVLSQRFVDACERLWPLFSGDVMFNNDNRITKIHKLLCQLISSEMDCDKADYLLRDAYYSGVSFGHYDLDALLNNITVSYAPGEHWFGLTISKKGLGTFRQFINARFAMYSNAYGNKSSKGLESLMQMAINEALDDDDFCKQIIKMTSDPSQYIWFTDSFMWSHFRSQALNRKKTYGVQLLNRQLPIYLGEVQGASVSSVENLKQSLADQYQVDIRTIIVNKQSVSLNVFASDFDEIRCRDLLKVSHSERLLPLSDFLQYPFANEVSQVINNKLVTFKCHLMS